MNIVNGIDIDSTRGRNLKFKIDLLNETIRILKADGVKIFDKNDMDYCIKEIEYDSSLDEVIVDFE